METESGRNWLCLLTILVQKAKTCIGYESKWTGDNDGFSRLNFRIARTRLHMNWDKTWQIITRDLYDLSDNLPATCLSLHPADIAVD